MGLPQMTNSPLLLVVLLSALLTSQCHGASPATSSGSARQPRTEPPRTYPGMVGFPDSAAWANFTASLEGHAIYASSNEYDNVTLMRNIRVTKRPYVVIMVRSVADVQKTVRFAKAHNLMLSVRSSGHSYIGRSTHDGAIVVDLALMRGRQFNLRSVRNEAGEATLESGNTWLEVYEAVDKLVTYDEVGNPQRRVIVGGSAHTVAMGGYTQGGGHSPISRSLGLAVDSLLEVTLVLADGRKAVASAQGTAVTEEDGTLTHRPNDGLFWALRGGGGGTWGVVTHFTFKLHYAPARIRNVAAAWALSYRAKSSRHFYEGERLKPQIGINTEIESGSTSLKANPNSHFYECLKTLQLEIGINIGQDIGSGTLKFLVQQLARLSPQWGGYISFSGMQLNADARGSVSVFLNHFGSDVDVSNLEVNDILAHNPYNNQFYKQDKNFSTFLGYEMTAKDEPYTYVYLANTFVQPQAAHNVTLLDGLAAFFMLGLSPPDPVSVYACTGVLLGGRMREVAEGATPVNPTFRSGLLSLSCALAWPLSSGRDEQYVQAALLMRDSLRPLGEGSYFNEPAEDMEDWKSQFWGDDGGATYRRLLQVKRQWDPDHFFWCHNCVGSDDVTAATGK